MQLHFCISAECSVRSKFSFKVSLNPQRTTLCCSALKGRISLSLNYELMVHWTVKILTKWSVTHVFRNRKVLKSNPTYTRHSSSDRTMALGSIQPLVKMSTRNIPGGNGGRCVMLTTSPPSRAECHEIWEPKPSGTLWATPGLLRDCCTFTVVLLWRNSHART